MATPIQPQGEPHKLYPPDTHRTGGAVSTLGKPLGTTASRASRPQPEAHTPPPSPSPRSQSTVIRETKTINRLLLQSACHLSLYTGPAPDSHRPISLQDPFHHLLQALRKADEACSLALSWHRFDLAPKAHLFRGHAYRAIGLWDMAYEAYVRAASYGDFARDKSEKGLEAVTRYCAERRDGKKLSVMRGRAKDGRRKGGVKGLFRCGTFGNLAERMREDAAATVLQEQGQKDNHDREQGQQQDQEQKQRQVEQGILESLGVAQDGAHDSNFVHKDGDTGNSDGGRGHIDGDSGIDWLAIGTSKPGPGCPPLRSAQAKLIDRRKLWTKSETVDSI